MPWSNQRDGGGRKGGGNGNGGGPWGQGPWGPGGGGGGGSNQPPDLDEILRRGQDKVKRVMRGGGGGGGGGGDAGVPRGFMFFLGMLAIAGIAFYGLFTCALLMNMRAELLQRESRTNWVRRLAENGANS